MEIQRVHVGDIANLSLLSSCSIVVLSPWLAQGRLRLRGRCQRLDGPVCPRLTALSLALFESFPVSVLNLLLEFHHFLDVSIGGVLQHFVYGHRIIDVCEVEGVLQQRVDVVVPP